MTRHDWTRAGKDTKETRRHVLAFSGRSVLSYFSWIYIWGKEGIWKHAFVHKSVLYCTCTPIASRSHAKASNTLSHIPSQRPYENSYIHTYIYESTASQLRSRLHNAKAALNRLCNLVIQSAYASTTSLDAVIRTGLRRGRIGILVLPLQQSERVDGIVPLPLRLAAWEPGEELF